MTVTRRQFIAAGLGGLLLNANNQVPTIMTVNGPISAAQLGKTLIHEHFLVDFIGADKITLDRWDKNEVLKIVSPHLLLAKLEGVKSFFDCTPAFLGRDVALLKLIAELGEVQVITNTGYYGARSNKFLPPWAFTETAGQLAARWVLEFEKGIDGTAVRPGFIKIGVDDAPLSDIHKKLITAAAITHLKTGLTICSHTGKAAGAFEQLDILDKQGVHPSAFVWVHAQVETDKALHAKAARMGAWVSLDGIGWGDFDNYTDSIERLKKENLLHRVLISHDAGWYDPSHPGGEFHGYTNIFSELLPRLRKKGFSDVDIEQLLVKNPAEAMGIAVRKKT